MKTITKKQLEAMLEVAAKTLQNSYSPYSKFKVGAALLTQNGNIYGGTNIENVSYGVTMCAERTALFSAVAAGERDFKALVVAFNQKKLEPSSTPCGVCRQALSEFFSADTPVYTAAIFGGKVQQIRRKKFKDYYPLAFSKEALQKPSANK